MKKMGRRDAGPIAGFHTQRLDSPETFALLSAPVSVIVTRKYIMSTIRSLAGDFPSIPFLGGAHSIIIDKRHLLSDWIQFSTQSLNRIHRMESHC